MENATSPSLAKSQPAANPGALPTTALNPELLRARAPEVHLRFLEAVQRDLRANVARVRLYLQDERTARVLLEHVGERVEGAYERWGGGVARLAVGAGTPGTMEVLSVGRVREMVKDVCAGRGEGSGGNGNGNGLA